jgi:hypothetical protein
MPMRKIIPWLAILLGLAGLTFDFYGIATRMMVASPANPIPRSLLDMLVYYWTFLTHLANLGLVLVYVSELTDWRWLSWLRTPLARGSMLAVIALVGLFFHFLLAPQYNFVGVMAVGNVLLHYVAPLLYLLWWSLYSPHGALRFTDIPKMLVPPLLYLAWAMLRGAVIHEYPYAIIDVTRFGYPQVAINAVSVFIGLAILCCLVVIADKLLARAPGLLPIRNRT